MSLPFTIDQFLSVFALYNNSIWPGQIFLNLLGILAIFLCFRRNVPSVLISTTLGGLWIWTGSVYHLVFFSTINPAAYIFGVLFILQGVLFIIFGTSKGGTSFGPPRAVRGYTGGLLLAYGLVVYPIVGYFQGHVYPFSPTFGAPCPTTIFTFGMLLWTTTRVRLSLIIIPLLWSLVGSTAALNLGVREDVGLLIAGIVGTTLLAVRKDFRGQSVAPHKEGEPGGNAGGDGGETTQHNR